LASIAIGEIGNAARADFISAQATGRADARYQAKEKKPGERYE
jgi:hypothetical protein